MKALILGASGIIGQHMRLCCPDGVEAVYARRTADRLHDGVDLTDAAASEAFLDSVRPDVIVNLAGENNTDTVERDPKQFQAINVDLVRVLVDWCWAHQRHLIQVSTQAVFSGTDAPYSKKDDPDPINEYGNQKMQSEAESFDSPVTVVRPTFVLGFRPLPHVGRPNPLEQILAGQRKQVNDRWFSISLAREVAELLWKCAVERTQGIVHIGEGRLSRYDVALRIGGANGIEPVSHDDFPGLAPRPIDTHYWEDASAILRRLDLTIKQSWDELLTRAREIALFLGKREDECKARLDQGWEAIHNAVTADWNAANPLTDDEILDWYRRTESYIWELSWYHADPGFNYTGMCSGIAERLRASGAKKILCLGDGIGDLTISLLKAGVDATYHDLAGSRTAEFAAFRSWMLMGRDMPTRLSAGWEPDLGTQQWDAIVSLDFLEHVTDVPAWCAAICGALKPGGLLVAQNAFGIGSGESGAMPMHLARNDRFEKDWDPLLKDLGFTQESSNWYRVPE